MLSFVQGWLAPRCNPIGIDFGSDSLRLCQVQWTGEEYKLIAAATADVPTTVRNDLAGRYNFFVETTRDLLAQGNFKGRQAILALPAATMFVRHLRMPKLDEDQMKKALPWELRGKLPIDPSHAVLRHVIAGEVYQDQEQKLEVIVCAAGRELVNQMLAAAARAKLDVIGMNIEPKAIIDCFSHVYRRKNDETATTCYVDIGCTASRAVVARGGEMVFARTIPVGGDQFSRAVADAMKISLQEAKILRVRLCANQTTSDEPREKRQVNEVPPAQERPVPEQTSVDQSFALLSSAITKHEKEAAAIAPPSAPAAPAPKPVADEPEGDEEATKVNRACREPLLKLVEELNLCRRYYESTFPNATIDRLVFIGGEARLSDIGIESGIDRRVPQPGWAVALGLSMGPRAGAKVEQTVDESNARG
jgi:type IV pilus assembly protein PilM